MATIENIEYYVECPSCGAHKEDADFCQYCGTSLIKSRTVTSADSERLTDVFFREDHGLKRVEGKTSDFPKELKLFCALFGGLFLFVPTFLCFVFMAVGIFEIWLLLFFGIFWVIGAASFIPWIRANKARSNTAHGTVLVGIVRGYENSNISVNDRPVQKVMLRLSCPDDPSYQPIILHLNTGSTNCKWPLGEKLVLRNWQDYYQIIE